MKKAKKAKNAEDSKNGNVAIDNSIAFGTLIIQIEMKLSDTLISRFSCKTREIPIRLVFGMNSLLNVSLVGFISKIDLTDINEIACVLSFLEMTGPQAISIFLCVIVLVRIHCIVKLSLSTEVIMP